MRPRGRGGGYVHVARQSQPPAGDGRAATARRSRVQQARIAQESTSQARVRCVTSRRRRRPEADATRTESEWGTRTRTPKGRSPALPCPKGSTAHASKHALAHAHVQTQMAQVHARAHLQTRVTTHTVPTSSQAFPVPIFTQKISQKNTRQEIYPPKNKRECSECSLALSLSQHLQLIPCFLRAFSLFFSATWSRGVWNCFCSAAAAAAPTQRPHRRPPTPDATNATARAHTHAQTRAARTHTHANTRTRTHAHAHARTHARMNAHRSVWIPHHMNFQWENWAGPGRGAPGGTRGPRQRWRPH
jgi:hypothetical protein